MQTGNGTGYNMAKSVNEKREILGSLGACPEDLDPLLEYTASAFANKGELSGNRYLERWKPVFAASKTNSAAVAINRYLVRKDFDITFVAPELVRMELYESFAGKIPIIIAEESSDFENIIMSVVFKNNPSDHMRANIKNTGAYFAHGAFNSFIVLSSKPYSNVPATSIGYDDVLWLQKSMTIRKHHEYTHYYTKRAYGVSRNNLHDELIADFCGIWAAFSKYEANYFMKFLDQGRFRVYTENMSTNAANVLMKLAEIASLRVEQWSASSEFLQLSEEKRIDCLCDKELLDFV